MGYEDKQEVNAKSFQHQQTVLRLTVKMWITLKNLSSSVV